jgi:hypothetical protein
MMDHFDAYAQAVGTAVHKPSESIRFLSMIRSNSSDTALSKDKKKKSTVPRDLALSNVPALPDTSEMKAGDLRVAFREALKFRWRECANY